MIDKSLFSSNEKTKNKNNIINKSPKINLADGTKAKNENMNQTLFNKMNKQNKKKAILKEILNLPLLKKNRLLDTINAKKNSNSNPK